MLGRINNKVVEWKQAGLEHALKEVARLQEFKDHKDQIYFSTFYLNKYPSAQSSSSSSTNNPNLSLSTSEESSDSAPPNGSNNSNPVYILLAEKLVHIGKNHSRISVRSLNLCIYLLLHCCNPNPNHPNNPNGNGVIAYLTNHYVRLKQNP